MTSSKAVGAGAFVVIGLLLFAVALFMIGQRRMLFIHPHIQLLQVTYAGPSVGDFINRHRLSPSRSTRQQPHHEE